MRVVYVADDGTCFDDEFECENYEWKISHPNLKDVRFFDENGIELEDPFSEETYNNSSVIMVLNDEAVKDLKDLTLFTGYYSYANINDVGEWFFDDEQQVFVKRGYVYVRKNI